MTQSQLLDVRQAAARSGRDPETIRRWIRARRLTATRYGNRWMVRMEDLDAAASDGRARMSFAEWADMILARMPKSRRKAPRSAADLVIEERWRSGDRLLDDHIRRVEESR